MTIDASEMEMSSLKPSAKVSSEEEEQRREEQMAKPKLAVKSLARLVIERESRFG